MPVLQRIANPRRKSVHNDNDPIREKRILREV
jgi:hypothetical protein